MSDDGIRLLGVVLCGGQSKRMGRDKALLVDSAGDRFLQLAHNRLAKVCERVCLSTSETNASNYQDCIDCDVVLDPAESFGPISGVSQSLVYAMENLFDGCLFNPVDTPALTDDDLRELTVAFYSDPTRVVVAVAGPESKRLEPLIAIYPTSLLETLQRSIDDQQYGLQRILQTLSVQRVELLSESCRNVNTPSDHFPS